MGREDYRINLFSIKVLDGQYLLLLNTLQILCKSYIIDVQVYFCINKNIFTYLEGGENVAVAHYMVNLRGPNQHSHITGHSVRNQRYVLVWYKVYSVKISNMIKYMFIGDKYFY